MKILLWLIKISKSYWHINWALNKHLTNPFEGKMKDFEIKHHSGYSIITITAANAKFQEAIEFKSLADEEIEKGFNNIIISLNECELIDSSFIGVLVVIWRKLKIRGGSLKLVKIGSFNHSVLHLSGVIEIFERYDSIEKAIDSFITPVPQFH